jgi:hypothetical protein
MNFHKGTLSLEDKEDQSGVVVTASFQLHPWNILVQSRVFYRNVG